ncbi:MAG: hypothetical protein HYV03_02705 [Deltaproteobacteria bacterium]|nr:hypothetical protein [Deltaproteobacteria bacterium]
MKSMTGYGAAEGPVGRGALFVELRSVNHRYCDLQLKIPPKLGSLDPRLRATIQAGARQDRLFHQGTPADRACAGRPPESRACRRLRSRAEGLGRQVARDSAPSVAGGRSARASCSRGADRSIRTILAAGAYYRAAGPAAA